MHLRYEGRVTEPRACLSADEIAGYIDRPCVTDPTAPASGREREASIERAGLELHVDGCEGCRQAVAAAIRAARSSATVLARNGRPQPVHDHHSLLTVDPTHYAVGEEIARGGMGRIMTARDRRLGRSVAIKELLVATGELRARFEREARITARLQHPAIVNLIEAGAWPSGELFYVMKLVSGQSLDHALEDCPTFEARLALLPHVVAAVDALAYAHDLRIIHRDLKPANVLVGKFGETVVIDWGLAKDLGDASGAPDVGPYRKGAGGLGETIDGSVMGTPAYMPPEQALGDAVDERADVYALGAMLYHLLAGAPPYTGTTGAMILDAVIAGPPPRLDERAPGVPPDLVTIVNKAMAHTAAERYPTAKELADDLKKFQTGQLVGAHRYSGWQLVRRWVRRHRIAVTVAAVATVLLAAVGVVSLQRIFREQARTDEQRQVAEQNRGEAEDLLGFMLVDLRDKLRPLGRVNLLGDVAGKAVGYYNRRGANGDAELSKLALARRNLGDVLLEQGDATAALREYRASLATTIVVVAYDPSARQRRNVSKSHRKVGDVLLTQGDARAALGAYRASLAISKLLATTDPSPENQQELAASHDNLAGVILALGDSAGALVEYRQALAIHVALAAGNPTSAAAKRELAVSHNHVGDVLLAQGDEAGALAAYRTSLAITNALVEQAPTNADDQRGLAASHSRIGDVLLAGGAAWDPKAGLAEYRAMLAISKTLAANDPTNAHRKRDLAASHSRVADALLAMESEREQAEGRAELRAALALLDQLSAAEPTNTAWLEGVGILRIKLGQALYDHEDLAGARGEFSAALAIAKTLAAKDPANANWQQDIGFAHIKLGNVAAAQGDLAVALREYEACLAIRQALAERDPANPDRKRNIALTHNKLGHVRLAQKDATGALAQFRLARTITEALLASEPNRAEWQSDLAGTHENIGDALVAQGQQASGVAEYASGLAVAKRLEEALPDDASVRELVTVLTAKARGSKRRRG
jgi:tetratricopeptide (TPR) repeat protein